jgi:DNA ligase-1
MKVMQPKEYENQDPKGWWMSEKLDGVRAVWNGRTLVSKNGNEFNAPNWFIEDLPDGAVLDGELWEGYGKFQKTVATVRADNGNWGRIKFMVFDVVSEGVVYEKRMARLTGLKRPAHCRIVDQKLCRDRQHLNEYESGILISGGEGVMLRRAGSLYDYEKSSNLLRMKKFQTDEAVVTGYTEGKGKHAGRIGALICEYMGKTFKLGTGITNRMRELPPETGSLVTFSFIGLTDAGKPRHASFLIERDYE